MNKELFGTVNGRNVYEYTISSGNIILKAMDLGAAITELHTPDRNGNPGDIAVGFKTAEDYARLTDNQGAAIGRYANRIKNGTFSIDGVKYQIPCNDGNNMLHGNNEFRDNFWELSDSGDDFLEFTYISPDGSNGFPGALLTKIRYTLKDSSLIIDYDAVSDKKTVICLTNHLYFNLNADATKTVYNHVLKINAEKFTPVDNELIPTGEIVSVEGTAIDFRKEKEVGKDILADDIVRACGGIDHNFCIDGKFGELREAAVMKVKENGRVMSVYTDLPGMQVYSGNVLREDVGKRDERFCKHGAICLETQFYPDTPNHPNFPQCTFGAGEHFKSRTVYKFEIAD